MKKHEVIIRSKDTRLEYSAPYLICKIQDEIKKIHSNTIDHIQILEKCDLSSSIFEMINKYGITIHFLNGNSNPIGKAVPYFNKLDKDAYKKQIVSSGANDLMLRGKSLEWLNIKFAKRLELLSEHVKVSKDSIFESYISSWYSNIAEAIKESNASILSKEAQNSKIYWKHYGQCLPRQFRFKNRSKNPGEDLTNVLLNYSYGIFYGMIERCIVGIGLDPCCGIFHVDGPGRKSLVYDMIEAFRHEAEKFVLYFVREKEEKLSQYPFKINYLPLEIKSLMIESWKKYNKNNKISVQVKLFVQEFKTYLEEL